MENFVEGLNTDKVYTVTYQNPECLVVQYTGGDYTLPSRVTDFSGCIHCQINVLDVAQVKEIEQKHGKGYAKNLSVNN